MKKIINKCKKATAKATIAICGLFITYSQAVYAATDLKAGIKNIETIMGTFVSGVGAIYVLWGIFEFSTAMSSGEGTMSSQAFKRMAGGVAAVLGPSILATILA